MDSTRRMGDGRRDQNYMPCPQCPINDPHYWKPRMHIPHNGRTDIVKCWNCGHEEPRFIESNMVAEEELKSKPHIGSRRAKACSCTSNGLRGDTVLYDAECPIHGLEDG